MTENIDKAVQAAIKKSIERTDPTAEGHIRDILTAALPHLPLGFEVKQLEWDDRQYGGASCRAESGYNIEFLPGDSNKFPYAVSQSMACRYETMAEAKTAAQADFERRVRECLDVKQERSIDTQIMDNVIEFLIAHDMIDESDEYSLQDIMAALYDNYTPNNPVDVAAVRRQALEEAAKVAGTVWPNSGALDIGHGSRIAAAIRALSAEPAQASYQERVKEWLFACFGEAISSDKLERCDRFIEEALELVQAIGYSHDRAHALVDYVFNREAGEPHQEVGGVMVTLAGLCFANDLDMIKAGEKELGRVWTKVDKIRAKQAAKPTGSALPIPAEPEQGDHIADVGKMVEADKWQPTHRHVKRGKECQKLGDAQVQCEDGLTDYELATVYVGSDGELWVRRKSEFEDGRFISLPAAPTSKRGE